MQSLLVETPCLEALREGKYLPLTMKLSSPKRMPKSFYFYWSEVSISTTIPLPASDVKVNMTK